MCIRDSFLPEGRETLPITVHGGGLRPLTYDVPMASAQLKTAVLLAGMYASGTTTVNEPAPSRNHTELMLPEYGVATTAGVCTASVTGPARPQASEVLVPGDPSSAAFLACAAVLRPESSIQIEDVSLNTARIGFVRTLERMGAQVSVAHTGAAGKEPYGIIEACYTPGLRGCEVPADKIAGIIDEIPVLALVAAHAHGITVFRQVGELRVKETDRLAAIMDGLAKLGVDTWCEGDDLYIEGQPGLQVPEGLEFDSLGDHRLAMTWSLVGLTGKVSVNIKDFGAEMCIRDRPRAGRQVHRRGQGRGHREHQGPPQRRRHARQHLQRLSLIHISVMQRFESACVRIPMRDGMRSLNLSNSVAIAAYEALRQQNWPGLA